MTSYMKKFTLFVMLSTTSAWGHEGSVYSEEVRNSLIDVSKIPNSVKIGGKLQCERISFTSAEVHALRVDALRNQSKNKKHAELLPRIPVSKPTEVTYKIVPGSEQVKKYFSDGHIYKQSTNLIRCASPYSDETFDIRVNFDHLEKLIVEPNDENKSFIVRGVFEDQAVMVINDEVVFIPCSVCFSLSKTNKLVRVLLPYRSFEKGEGNDFFDPYSWRWFGNHNCMAQLPITQEKYGVNVTINYRVYLFNRNSTELNLIDTAGLGKGKFLDFDADPIELTVMPVKAVGKDGKEEDLLIRIK